jgi:hypothetical protein
MEQPRHIPNQVLKLGRHFVKANNRDDGDHMLQDVVGATFEHKASSYVLAI